MRKLILYAVLVIIGTVVAAFAGSFVERQMTDAGVVVFLALFSANFYVSLVITRTVAERIRKARRRWRIINQRSIM